MRRFLLKTLVALLMVLVLHAFVGRFADGHLDEFYLRFTGGQQRSMILGTSRAAQGIRPAVLMASIGSLDRGSLFNFAFTVDHSPYGPTYLRAVRAKLDPAATDGLFLVSVDPWSLCDDSSKEAEPGAMAEERMFLGKQWTFNGTPNYEYLLRQAPAGWGSFLCGPLHDVDTSSTLHTDGWLEVRVSLDNEAVAKRTAGKVRRYRDEKLPYHHASEERMRSLEELLDLLRPHGRVVLVRIPVCDTIARIEEKLWPGFTKTISDIAVLHDLDYWDLMSDSAHYTYVDGNHLDTISSRIFSADLARRLASTENTTQ